MATQYFAQVAGYSALKPSLFCLFGMEFFRIQGPLPLSIPFLEMPSGVNGQQ